MLLSRHLVHLGKFSSLKINQQNYETVIDVDEIIFIKKKETGLSSSHRVHVDDVDADDADVETRARAVQSRHLRRTTRINLPSYNPGAGWAPQGTAAHISYLLDEQSRGLK